MNPYALIIAQNTPSRATDEVTAALTETVPVNTTVAAEIKPTGVVPTDGLPNWNKVPFPAVEQRATQGTPYVKTDAVGVKLSGTDIDGVPDASAINELLTRKQIEDYMSSVMYGMKAIDSISNGFTANSSYKMKANNEEWKAKQNDRSARLLLMNQREINRAAQMDANVYKLQGAQTKSRQKVAMAASGFAVGKGIYANTLDTTDTRTTYNTAAIMLKAELQNAELVRKAGNYEAEAIINRANADINRRLGKAAMWDGVLDSIAYLGAAGAYFYIGKYGYGNDTTKTAGSGGQKTGVK